MNDGQEQAWSQGEHLETMNAETMDFSNLLDLGDLDLANLPNLDHDSTSNAALSAQHVGNGQYGANMLGIQGGHAVHDFAAQDYSGQALGQEFIHSNHGSSTDLHDFGLPVSQSPWEQLPSAQQSTDQMQQYQDIVYRQPNAIPPTPNSYELHGGDQAGYLQQLDPQTRASLEHQFQQSKQRDSFTPLVSPAVTPQDSHFHTSPEYAVPGAYFSPLTSPALQAQNAAEQYLRSQGHYTRPSTAASSPAAGTYDVDMTGDGLSLPEPARKPKRKTQASRSTGPTARTTRSPIVKGQKRKSDSLSLALASKEMEHVLRAAQTLASPSSHKQNTSSTDNSGPDSISPEPLSDLLMGPPPRPGSSTHSPALLAQTHSAPSLTSHGSAAPATPASLMSIENSRKMKSAGNGTWHPHSAQALGMARTDMASLDDFVLPPSAAVQRPSSSHGVLTMSAESTPRIATRKTPKLGPLSTASPFNKTSSATSSPAISAMTSPASATTPGFSKYQDKSGKGGKKRGSVGGGSSMVSPALRPKISPSIKPLLPEGGAFNDSQQALLLASKSNYTHLLEGTHLPGVSYPDSLSSGLTSKRTSHKIAEQGRRNRINDALKEMQTLLPPPVDEPKTNGNNSSSSSDCATAIDAAKDKPNGNLTKGSPKPSSAAASAASEAKAANSKAATVEYAIEYIKTLQMENIAMVQAMKSKDDELNALRKRLGEVDVAESDEAQNLKKTEVSTGHSTSASIGKGDEMAVS